MLHGSLPVTVTIVPCGSLAADLEFGADHVGAVFHDFEAHPGAGWCCARESHAVIGDAQGKNGLRVTISEISTLLRVPMSGGIGQRFLC